MFRFSPVRASQVAAFSCAMGLALAGTVMVLFLLLGRQANPLASLWYGVLALMLGGLVLGVRGWTERWGKASVVVSVLSLVLLIAA